MNVELRHLRHFAAVAETRHFGRAADRLHMAQPALSQSIRQLEKELGTSLFTRTTRQVNLTPAGEFMLEEALRVIGAVQDSVRGVRRVAEGRKGLVRIGFTGSASFTQLPRIARALQHDLPDVALEVHADLLTPAQVSGLSDGSLDIGILRPPLSGDGLAQRTIEIEPLVLAAPADHPLASKSNVEMNDLRDEDFVLFADTHSAVNEAVTRSCTEAGFAPRKEHEAPGTAALLALIAAGLGVALVPASVQALTLDGIEFRDVVDSATVELACAWRRDAPSPLVTSVLDSLAAAGVFADTPVTPIHSTPDTEADEIES